MQLFLMARSWSTSPKFNFSRFSAAFRPGQCTNSSTYKKTKPKCWKITIPVHCFKRVDESHNDTMGFKIMLMARKMIWFPLLFISKCILMSYWF